MLVPSFQRYMYDIFLNNVAETAYGGFGIYKVFIFKNQKKKNEKIKLW